jgi:hypothetical protein
MFNPVIIVAIIIQALIARASRIAGAVVGFLITTGILLWGITVYGEGNRIALFGIPLSEPIFFIACLVWYGFDVKDFMSARNADSAMKQVLASPLIREDRVVRFYQSTRAAWAAGRLSLLGKNFANEGRMLQSDFIKKYPPYEGSALKKFFESFQPLEGEFLIGLGNLPNATYGGWFVLTNLRLIQRDGRDDSYKEVLLANVGTYQFKGTTLKSLVFQMKTGEEISFEKMQMYPTDKFLSTLISYSI